MLSSRLALPAAVAALTLAACGEEPVADTSYEESLPAPVAEGGDPNAPVPDNTSMTSGPDEQVDAMASGDEVPVEENPGEPDE